VLEPQAAPTLDHLPGAGAGQAATVASHVPTTVPGPALRVAGISGLGTALPGRVVANQVIADRFGVDPSYIERRTGIRSRRMLEDGERLTDLATEAGRAALADAGLDARDLDMVLVATLTADEVTPGAAPQVAHALGTTAAAIDLNAACVGFLSGLQLACATIEARRAEHVLVIGAEAMLRITDPLDKSTAMVFADGAGAALVSVGAGALSPVVLRSDGELAPLIRVDHGERRIHMDGHGTFISAVAALTRATTEACAAAELELEDVDLFVFHQANRRILEAVSERLGLDPSRVVDVIADMGNTSAATLPLALAAARDQGRLFTGARVLLGAMGAGFVYGAGVLTWG
jgi:3-oxoacyl-[acyl-carrier-protein] synthase-3